MKYLIVVSLITYCFISPQEVKLNGKYKMQYEEKYNAQNCIINFTDSTYTRKLPNGKTIRGIIKYKKFNISLKDENSFLQMDFMKRELQRDTIFFGTTDLNDKPSNSELTVNSGKLIKIR
jgi:hypothetical protein